MGSREGQAVGKDGHYGRTGCREGQAVGKDGQ